MRRRRFLEVLALGASVLVAVPARLLRGRDAGPDEHRFYVAGVRFHRAASRVRAGEPLEVRPETFAGEACFGLYGSEGSRVGYVPREWVGEVAKRTVRRAVVSEVRPLAVPWKRLRVTIELD